MKAIPFALLNDAQVVLMVSRGKQPPRLRVQEVEARARGFDNTMLQLMEWCCHPDPYQRPNASKIAECLRTLKSQKHFKRYGYPLVPGLPVAPPPVAPPCPSPAVPQSGTAFAPQLRQRSLAQRPSVNPQLAASRLVGIPEQTQSPRHSPYASSLPIGLQRPTIDLHEIEILRMQELLARRAAIQRGSREQVVAIASHPPAPSEEELEMLIADAIRAYGNSEVPGDQDLHR
ncbi:hypothetical protein BOTBODRAFT_399284 [Botryobasidium botryosum FD-172 SS1]|uniref:Uncharacterized protein n=1 Tax=Botryobasidium botryosum (strain FD-172 SS1) TaxID=930990 RepID=A0A067MEW8_BOTB1|nr:hypothetical protein BOTBODRAFT_399284 [Botryobasidium botryosum FD-172 SS1]